MTGNADHQAVLYKWAKVVSIATDGTTVTNGIGPIVLNDIIPSDAILTEVRSKLANGLQTAVKSLGNRSKFLLLILLVYVLMLIQKVGKLLNKKT